MNRFDSAFTARQRGGGFVQRFKTVAATLLSLLVVGSIAATAQPTLTHVGPPPPAAGFTAGQICSGQTPQFDVGTVGRNVVTYNVANPAWPGILAEDNANDIIDELGDDQVYHLPGADIAAEAGGAFEFTFFGRTHDLSQEGLFIGTNGFLRFQDGDPTNDGVLEMLETGIIAQGIPNGAGPNNAIYFLNCDLAPQAAEDIDWEIMNDGVGDVLVVTFRDVSQYNPLLAYPYNQVYVQVIIYPDNYAGATPSWIEVRLDYWPDPGVLPNRTHTIGVEDMCGGSAFADGDHNNNDWPNTNGVGEDVDYAVTFEPVDGALQTLQTTLYVVGPNGVINTYSVFAAAPDDIGRSATTGGTTGTPVGITSSNPVFSNTPAGELQFFAVVLYEDCTIEVTNTVTLTVNPTPTVVNITGPIQVCVGTVYNYSVPLNNGNTYQWSTSDGAATINPAGLTLNGNAATIQWATGLWNGLPQSVTCVETTPAGCQATHNTFVVVYTVPNGTISGPATPCSNGANSVYVISGGPYGSYSWSVIGGTAGVDYTIVGGTTGSSLTVDWIAFDEPGAVKNFQIDVTVTNGPGGLCSFNAVNFPVQLFPQPRVRTIAVNDALGNPLIPCVDQDLIYSLTPTTGAAANTFTWTFGGGSFTFLAPNAGYINGASTTLTSIAMEWDNAGAGRTVTVVETTPNGCTRTFNNLNPITVEALPTPTISGPTTDVCGTQATVAGNPAYQTFPMPLQHVYAVNFPTTTNGYSWSIPAASGSIVAAGPGTATPTPGAGVIAVSGTNVTNITVQWTNPATGATFARTVNVTETSPNGCAGIAPTLNVTVTHTPIAADFALAGRGIPLNTINPCAGQTYPYTGTVVAGLANSIQNLYAVSGAVLVNTVVNNATTTTFDVQFGATASAVLRHEVIHTLTGCTAWEDYTINIQSLPEGDISGPTTVCGGTPQGQNIVYSVINQSAGITVFAWTETNDPQNVAAFDGAVNAANVTIDFANPVGPGSAPVTIQCVITGPAPTNCTNTLTYNITVNHTPAAPTITGDDGDGVAEPGEAGPPFYVCAGTTENYVVSGIAGGTTTISLVNGTTPQIIFAGAGPFNVPVTWGNPPNGTISATITLNNCISAQTSMVVTISPLPAEPTFEYSLDGITYTAAVPPLCALNTPFYVRIANNTVGITYNWNGWYAGGGPVVSVTSDLPGGGTNELHTFTSFGAGGSNIWATARATNDVTGCQSVGTGFPGPLFPGFDAPQTSTPQIFVAPVPTPVINGPTDACNNIYDPAGMNGATIAADPQAFTYEYFTQQNLGNSYSWTVTNGYVVATSTDNGGSWNYLNPIATTTGAPILNANRVLVVFYGVTPGKVKVSEIAPGGCQATTLDYNVNLNDLPVQQTLIVWTPDICYGQEFGVVQHFNSEVTYNYRVELSSDGGATWFWASSSGTQAGNGADLFFLIWPFDLFYAQTPPAVQVFQVRITAEHIATGCSWYPVSNIETINVNPVPDANVPVSIVTPYTCEGDDVVISVGNVFTPSESWVRYRLMRTQIADLNTGAPIAPIGPVYVGSDAVGNGVSNILLFDNTDPAGGFPLLNSDVYTYTVEAVSDMSLAPPPTKQCTTYLNQTVNARVFALPVVQTVTYSPNPICWEDDLTVDLGGSQDGVEYEVLRDGVSMAPPVIVDGDGNPVQVTVPAVQVMPTNPLVPTSVTFSVQARLRSEAFAPYDRPIPPSACPVNFGAMEVTVNPKPVAVINGDDEACGPSTHDYTPGPSWGGWPAMYDWRILLASDPYPVPHSDPPLGTTPMFANNTGFGTVNPFTVDWGVHLLTCNGTYNPITVVIEMIETNVFMCPDTAYKEITIQPTVDDAIISGPTTACIYGGFEQHLTTYTIARPGVCVFPAGTTWLWDMPTGPVVGVIRSGQGTPTIIVEWHATGGTNIGTIECAVTLPPSHGGCTTVKTYDVIVYPLPQPIVVGPTQVCQNAQNVQYSADSYPTDTYTWIVVGGTVDGGSGAGTIASPGTRTGVGLNVITVDWLDAANPNAYVRLNQISLAGCYNTNTLAVTVNPTPTPVIGGPGIVCDNSVYQYSTQNNAPNNVYQWTITGNAVINSGANQATVTIQTGAIGGGTTFTLGLTETVQATTCTKTVSRIINIVQKPNPQITRVSPAGPVGGACLNQTITYGNNDPVAGNPGFAYQWVAYNGTITGSSTSSTVVVTWNTVGTGTLTLSKWHTGSQCTTTVSMDVNIAQPPQPAISGPVIVCGDVTATYSTPWVNGNTYSWSISGNGTIMSGALTNAAVIKWNNPVPGGTLASTVTVTETNTLSGCAASAVVNVQIRYQPQVQNIVRVSPAGPLNQACLTDVITYALPVASPGATYQWTVTGGTFIAGQNSSIVTVQWTSIGAQTLSVVEKNATGDCQATSTLNVSVSYKPTPAIVGPIAPCTDENITYCTPAVPGSTYNWTITPAGGFVILSGTTSNCITVRFTTAGPRTITVTETNGLCVVATTLNINVTLLPQPLITRVSPAGDKQLACEGDIITYSTPPVAGNTYLWTLIGGGSIVGSNTSNTVTVHWVAQGTYALTVLETTPGGGCFNESTLWVTVTYKPTPNINGPNVACIEKILTYFTPAVPGDTYLWSITPSNSFAPVVGYPNSNSITVQWILPGLHTVTVTETNVAGGCQTTVSMNVQVNEIPTPFITSTTGYGNPPGRRPGIVCNFSTHTYTTFPTPGNTFHFFVTGGTINGNPYTNTVSVTWGAAGVGTIWVVETIPGSDCITTKRDTIDIRPTPAPVITGNGDPCGASTQLYTTPFVTGNSYQWTVVGAASWNVVPGNPNQISVVWQNPTWPNVVAGSVSVTEWVTDVLPFQSCIATATRSITVRPNPPVPTITGPGVVCATDLTDTPPTNNIVTYTTSNPGGVTFQWTVSANGTISGSSTATSVNVQWANQTSAPTTGTITVVHTSVPYGCTSTMSLNVTINPLPTPDIVGSLEVCQGTTHAYRTNSVLGNTYSWTVTGGNIIRTGQGTSNVTVEWSVVGTHTLTVAETNSYGCTVSDQVSVLVRALPSVTITASGPTTFCQGGDVTLTAPVGFASYVWSTGETSRSIVVRVTGTYWVRVTDQFGCSNTSNSITVNVFPSSLPIISVSGPTTFCEGGSVVLTAPAGFSNYLWSTGATTQSITVTTSGVYTVTVADNNGCTGTSTEVDVFVNPKPAPILTVVGSTTICSGDSVEVRAPAGYVSYTWNSTSGSNYGNGRSIWVSQTDQISVVVVDINGCVGESDTVDITVSPVTPPIVTPNGPTTFCDGGSVVLEAPAGYSSYIWSNGATSREITVEDGGNYYVTVTNAAQCMMISTGTTVTVNPLPDRPTIERRGDTLTAQSATAQSWQWYKNGVMIPGATEQKLLVNERGTYRVEIADNNSCSAISNGFDVLLTDVSEEGPVTGLVSDIRLYPNPTNGQFTIETEIAMEGSVRIDVVNTIGEVVMSLNDVSSAGSFKRTVEMGVLANGVYNVVVTTGNQRWTVKLVRQ